jgi:hypothetical protein
VNDENKRAPTQTTPAEESNEGTVNVPPSAALAADGAPSPPAPPLPAPIEDEDSPLEFGPETALMW